MTKRNGWRTWPWHMLEHAGHCSGKELRSFGCSRSRRVWNLITSDRAELPWRRPSVFRIGMRPVKSCSKHIFRQHLHSELLSLGTGQRDNDFAMIHALQAGMCPPSEKVASACWDATKATKAVRAAKRASGENGNAVGPERDCRLHCSETFSVTLPSRCIRLPVAHFRRSRPYPPNLRRAGDSADSGARRCADGRRMRERQPEATRLNGKAASNTTRLQDLPTGPYITPFGSAI